MQISTFYLVFKLYEYDLETKALNICFLHRSFKKSKTL